MFGWEFPPISSGGLGTACQGLTKGLGNNNVDVIFVLPKAKFLPEKSHVEFLVASDISNIKVKKVDSLLIPYAGSNDYQNWRRILKKKNSQYEYGENLFEEVKRYAEIAGSIAKNEDFDIIHVHDWMTYEAGIAAKKASGKPLIAHIHATAFDIGGGNPNPEVYEIEKQGFNAADRVIAVSEYTKNMVVEHYGIPAEKIDVVHNAVEHKVKQHKILKIGTDNIVLFLGRITLQKGPDYFLDAAKLVLDKRNDVTFIIVGSGDMMPEMIEKATHLEIADKVLFAGFLTGSDIGKAYQMADLYVMPSVSEPFGITPLEALNNETPVIISKQSGVSEVLKNCLKVDFWDTQEIASKILAVLEHKPLKETLSHEGHEEVNKLSWDDAAQGCINVYNKVA